MAIHGCTHKTMTVNHSCRRGTIFWRGSDVSGTFCDDLFAQENGCPPIVPLVDLSFYVVTYPYSAHSI